MDHRALQAAQALLQGQRADNTRPEQPFRTRASHIQRVCMWAERLLVQGTVAEPAALRLAAAFHDVGYLDGKEQHGASSVKWLMAYARDAGVPVQTAERAAFLVREHSNKDHWLARPDAQADLVLLMEADLLDEEGAMGLALDCMSAGALGLDYAQTYARMQRFEPMRLARNPMVTPLARQFWERKQQVIRMFIEEFAFDLGIDDETT